MFSDNRLSLSLIAVAFILSVSVSPVMADFKPLTEEEMSNVTGKSDVKQIVSQAQTMDNLDPVFKEIKTLSSSERLQQQKPFGGVVNNPMTRDVTTRIAQEAVQNPATTARIATSGTVQEMAKIAATAGSIFKGLVGNAPSNR